MIQGSDFTGNVHPDSEFPVHICLQRCLTAGVSHRMVSFRWGNGDICERTSCFALF